ncbi:MAG TPA: SET domain-containing protein [Pirellulaceae bacterium]|jgi:hypothetical protein
MLLVKTYLDKSSISGIGLFAAEPIEEGTLVWKLNDLDIVIHERDLKAKNLSDVEMQFVERVCYMNGNTYYICIDDARFMNHSNDPNTYEKGQSSIARRRIEAGEEITADYGNYDDSKKHLPYAQKAD